MILRTLSLATSARLFLVIFALIITASAFATKPALQIGAVLLLLLTIFTMLGHRALWTNIKKPEVYFTLILFTLLAASAIWSLDPTRSLTGAATVFTIAAGGILIGAAAWNLPFSRTLTVYGLGGAMFLAAFYILLSHITHYSMYQFLFGGRPGDFENIFNKASGVLALMGPAVVLFCWKDRLFPFALKIGLPLVLVLAVFNGPNQSSQLGLLVATAFFFLPVDRPLILKSLRVLLLIGVLLAPVIADFMFEPFAEQTASISWLREGSTANRLEIWDAIAHKIYERPLAGYGYDSARLIDHFDSAQLYQPGTTIMHTHNSVLQLWLDFGFLGAIAGAFFLWHSLGKIGEIDNVVVRRLYLSSFMAAFAVSLVGWGLWQGWWLVLLVLTRTLNIIVAGQLKTVNSAQHGTP